MSLFCRTNIRQWVFKVFYSYLLMVSTHVFHSYANHILCRSIIFYCISYMPALNSSIKFSQSQKFQIKWSNCVFQTDKIQIQAFESPNSTNNFTLSYIGIKGILLENVIKSFTEILFFCCVRGPKSQIKFSPKGIFCGKPHIFI